MNKKKNNIPVKENELSILLSDEHKNLDPLQFNEQDKLNEIADLESLNDLEEDREGFEEYDPFPIEISPTKLTKMKLPVLLLDEAVAVPYIHQQLPQTVDINENIINSAIKNEEIVVVLYRRNSEATRPDDICSHTGIIGRILKYSKDSTVSEVPIFLFRAGERVKVKGFSKPDSKGNFKASVKLYPIENDLGIEENKAYLEEIKKSFDRLLQLTDRNTPTMASIMQKCSLLESFFYALFSSPVETSMKDEVMSMSSLSTILPAFLMCLVKTEKYHTFRISIQEQVEKEIAENQRENFIREEITFLRDELGESETNDIDEFTKRAKEKNWNEETAKHFKRELQKLQRFPANTPDYSIQYTYLDNLLSLPWNNYAESDFNFENVEKILNRDHYGLQKVKERILEQIAVAKLRKDNRAPILCFVGPPGVGKTSLGKSIAEALGREYARVSFGGMHDEAEIRGHRRTYIGAMPGRLISALMKENTSNPVMLLDEIDKIGKDFKGDPAMALLEVLDPEQNSRFHDNYIDTDYDFSNILFIATANSLETVSAPLLDRLEIISLPGYITAEKVEIAKRHLLPKQLRENGFEENEIDIEKEGLVYLIDYYTREAGVRKLEKTIAKILRKLAVMKVRGEEYPTMINTELIAKLLGKVEFNPDMYDNNDFTGVVTGLAWTSVGGEILFIESSVTPGKGKLTLTGNLGDVMKESATLALQYLRAHSSMLGLNPEVFEKSDFHIHVPEGAIPKDGPSAGITLATSLASALTGRKVRAKLAMTGEITLRGKVLPVGGIKEKIIAAKRAGITEIILSRVNEKDITEIQERYLEGLTFTYVDTIEQVLNSALL